MPRVIKRAEVNLASHKKQRLAVVLPEKWEHTGPIPLLVALHFGWGEGPTPAFYGNDYMKTLVAPALEDLPAVLLAPDCPGPVWNHPTSVNMLLELLTLSHKEFGTDPDRVALTGFSLGGMGVWYLLTRYGGLFSAAIPMETFPVISTMVDQAVEPGRFEAMLEPESEKWLEAVADIPIYAIHSRQDELFPFEKVETLMNELSKRRDNVTFVAVDSLGHYQASGFTPYLRAAVPWLRKIWKLS